MLIHILGSVEGWCKVNFKAQSIHNIISSIPKLDNQNTPNIKI